MLTVDFQTLALGSGQTLLDVGCGEGRHTLAAYLKSGVLALGVDLGLSRSANSAWAYCRYGSLCPRG